MKVLVTIGTMTEKNFTRLFQCVDKLCEERILEGRSIIAQVGEDHYKSAYYKCIDLLSRDEFNELIEWADIVITHAGTGSVTSCLKAKKKVIIFPRLTKYNEHYDDHQLELADVFVKKGYALCALTYEELKRAIIQIDDYVPVQFCSNNKKMVDLLCEFIEK